MVGIPANKSKEQIVKSLFLLFLICSIRAHAHRQTSGHSLAIDSTSNELKALVASGSNETSGAACFGLCVTPLFIATVSGLFAFSTIGAVSVISYHYSIIDNYLSSKHVTLKDIAAIATQGAEIALASKGDIIKHHSFPHLRNMSTEEVMQHAEAVFPIAGMPEHILQRMASTCGRGAARKNLGGSSSSSRSGAVFFTCTPPGQAGDLLWVGDKVKAIRNSTVGAYTIGDIGTADEFGKIHSGEERVKVVWQSGRWTTHGLDAWKEAFEQDIEIDAAEALSPQVLLKAGVRDSDTSPEWSTLTWMAPNISKRYSDASLLNKVILGFTAWDLRWIAMQDVSADRLMGRLEKDLGIPPLRNTELEWRTFDIKPAGSRAPQLPECFQALTDIAKHMGPVNQFKGWDRMVTALEKDLAFLKNHNVIDESLFVQTLGPIPSNLSELSESQRNSVLEVLGNAPMCAFQHMAGHMAIICVTVLDYLLSLSMTKKAQNVFQGARWDDYEEKVTNMMSCIGELTSAGCEPYKLAAEGRWREVVAKQYDLMPKSSREQLDTLQKNWNCCCNITETQNSFTMETMCTWVKRENIWHKCPNDLALVKLREGGCLDSEPEK